MNTFSYQLITCEKPVSPKKISSALVPGKNGDLQILFQYTPSFLILRPGIAHFELKTEEIHSFFLFGGVCLMDGYLLTIVTSRAVKLLGKDPDTLSHEVRHFQHELDKAYISYFNPSK